MDGIKNVVSIRKLAYGFIIICLLSLTACMSGEEKEKAKKNEALARPIVQEYLNLNYASGKIDYLKCLNKPTKDNGPMAGMSKFSSSYVKASVLSDEKEFSVIVNVETGQCYDDYNKQLIQDDLKKHAISSLSIDVPYDVEVDYYQKELDGELADSNYDGFTEYGIKSADDLFQQDQYEIYLICKYISSDMDFGGVDTKGFFPASDVSDVYLALVNFRSKDRYIKDISPMEKLQFQRADHYYSLCDVVSAYKEKKYDSKSDDFVYDDNINYSYFHYPSKTINGIEFTWNDSWFALDFQEVPAQKTIQLPDLSKKVFNSTSNKAVSVDCTLLLDDLDDVDKRTYCFFEKDKEGSKVIVTENDGDEKRYETWYNEWSYEPYIYHTLAIYEKKSTFVLGYYDEK